MRLSSKLVALAAALHLAAVPALASAAGVSPTGASPAQREQAQAKFTKGKELLGQKKYAEALAEFQGSVDVVASPNARLFIARTLREMNKLAEAYAEFGRTEKDAKALAPSDARYAKTADAAAAERQELAPKLAFVTVTLKGPTEQTRLTIAGGEVDRAGWNEPAPVQPGTFEVTIETPNVPAVRRLVTLGAGEKTAIDVDAATGSATGGGTPIGTATEVKPPPTVEPAKASPAAGSGYRTYAYVAGGVGAAGLLTFGIFGAMTAGTYADLKDACGDRPCPASKQGDVDSGKTTQTIANVGLIVGVVGAAAGVTLFVLSKPKKPSDAVTTQAVVGPSYVGLAGTF
jgi:hypothetical protein